MKDKIFLTGPRGIGKSTCLINTLNGINCSVGGFRTKFSDKEHSVLLLSDIQENQTQIVAKFIDGSRFPITHTFDSFGVDLLSQTPIPELLVMDELGFLEKEAYQFQKAVLKALDEDVPILGVLREESLGWLVSVRSHIRTEIITVTLNNRDSIPFLLKEKLASLGIR